MTKVGYFLTTEFTIWSDIIYQIQTYTHDSLILLGGDKDHLVAMVWIYFFGYRLQEIG